MADACTGVIRVKPMDETASLTHCDNGGFTPSQDLDDAAEGGFGAIAAVTSELTERKCHLLDLVLQSDLMQKSKRKKGLSRLDTAGGGSARDILMP